MTSARVPRRRLPWRLRVALVTLPGAVAMFAAVALTSASDDAPADLVDLAAETRCLPITLPTSVGQLNEFVGSLRGGKSFRGADVGADVLLQDGRRLWVFGDTLRADDDGGQEFVRNSMLVFDDRCANVVLPPGGGALIPDRDDGVGYWPMSIARVERPGYDLVGVGVQRVRSTDEPDGAFAFENLGPSVALFLVRAGDTPQLLEVTDLGKDRAGTKRPTWGAASAVVGDWVYTYGTANDGDTFGYSLRVARARPEDIADQSRWQYWDGERWQRKASRADVLIPAQGGVSQTLSVFESGGRWYAVSKRDEFLGTDVVIWSAPRPTGPFTAGPPVASIPSEEKSGTLRYMPLAHPDLLPKKGTVVISYSQNNSDLGKVADDPFLYRPRFLRADLP